MDIPENLRYTKDHEWARQETAGVTIGITDFAQEALGDVVFVELPLVGSLLSKGAKMGEVESTKSVSEVYAPVAGTVTSVNALLASTPETINVDPYGRGWFCVIEPSVEGAFEELLDADAYQQLTEE